MDEQIVCMVRGKEEFKIVSPIFRQNIYVGVFESYKNYETPVDFFNPDYKRFP
jgi:hypothetical protein